jgi:FkbM family methyltransferase
MWCSVKKHSNSYKRKQRKLKKSETKVHEDKNNVFDKGLLKVTKSTTDDSVINTIFENNDVNIMATAKANWYFGQWQKLADINLESIINHQSISIIAALKAAGYQQINDEKNTRKYIGIAKSLGCEPRLIAKILIAGVHNSLGKIAAINENKDKIESHFNAAVDIGDKKNANLVKHSRAVREMTSLGLLPQAASLLNEELLKVKSLETRPTNVNAKLKILETEVELINHELSLSLKKNQLYSSFGKNASIFNDDDSINLKRLQQLSPSQLGQDLWALEQTKYKKGGFFVEFGATDGVLLSNSYLLEQEFAWKGICAEPNPAFFSKLKKNRNCIVSDACISDETGNTVEFILANEYGGIADIAKAGRHGDKVAAYEKDGKTIVLKTISLNDFLIEHEAPKTIDYLSIDTEGSEFSILSTFPFESWHIQCLSVEHNYEPQRDLIYDLLTSKGYERTSRQWDDLYFINWDVE